MKIRIIRIMIRVIIRITIRIIIIIKMQKIMKIMGITKIKITIHNK